MNNSPESVIEKQVAAYNERNIEKFISCFSEDVEFFTLKDNKRTLSGKDELKKGFEKLFSSNPNLDLKIKTRIVSGNYVTDLEVVHGASAYPNGTEITSINLVENGLIRKIWFTEAVIY